MLSRWLSCCMAAAALNAQAWAAQKNAPEAHHATEVLTCRNGTEDRHARIAVVLVGGKADSFAYYSKWKPRTCSIYLQRKHDAFSRWRDKGAVTMVDTDRGAFLIEHGKGEYRIVFRNIDRQRYCGMDGLINGTLTIRRGSERCELAGIMEEGVPLGQAWAYANGTAGSSANTVAAAPSAASSAQPAMTPAGGSPPLVASTSRATAAAARRSSTTPWYMRFWQDIPAPTPEPAWPARGD